MSKLLLVVATLALLGGCATAPKQTEPQDDIALLTEAASFGCEIAKIERNTKRSLFKLECK